MSVCAVVLICGKPGHVLKLAVVWLKVAVSRILFSLSRNGWSGLETETIIYVCLLNQRHMWKCLKTAWSVCRVWRKCVGRVREKKGHRESKRRESGRESVRERKGARLLISSKSASWYWLASITAVNTITTAWHSRVGTPRSDTVKKQRCYIILFLHRGSTIDRIPYWQTLQTFLTACIRNPSSTEREQQ